MKRSTLLVILLLIASMLVACGSSEPQIVEKEVTKVVTEKIVETVIVEAVRSVDGVVQDRPVDVLLMKVSKSGLTFRLRWWLESYQEGRYAPDKVLRAVYAAMLETGIELSLDAYDINLIMEDEATQKSIQISQSEVEDG